MRGDPRLILSQDTKPAQLANLPREVGNGVRDVVVGHGEDGELRDGAVLPDDAPRALVDGRQVRVHVPLLVGSCEGYVYVYER